MSGLRWIEGKDPADEWDYTLDATRWMAEAADTLVSVVVEAAPGDITIGSTATTPEGLATVRLSGGQAGTDYGITFTMTTAAGRTLQRTVQLRVQEL
ncbi:hypothetical protein GXW78_07560 [Roseomonas terrae]|uniref:Uncharacterized protein n=1 Tax=Neoroseomonas terrae TaxID=424799 RepID=A0ABS5EER0_9PROT|nr:hypothetical protein [Neoroseomonas terrae]MBR0649511.1 hypothetical protein [Neoroseomonas terrae]